MKIVFLITTLILSTGVLARQKPYYYQIPDTPAVYTAANVAARMIDGLGFRYYWATDGLTEKDMNFKPGDNTRTTFETLEHINGLTKVLLNAVSGTSTKSGGTDKKISFAQIRSETLTNIQTASEILKKPENKLEGFDMIFERQNGSITRYPFWNLINGPIADSIWHVGQVVSFRRSSGNPFPEGVNVLQGTKSD